MKRAETDGQRRTRQRADQLADELYQMMAVDPWRTWSRTELAKRLGKSSERLRTILENDPRFISRLVEVDAGRRLDRWALDFTWSQATQMDAQELPL